MLLLLIAGLALYLAGTYGGAPPEEVPQLLPQREEEGERATPEGVQLPPEVIDLVNIRAPDRGTVKVKWQEVSLEFSVENGSSVLEVRVLEGFEFDEERRVWEGVIKPAE